MIDFLVPLAAFLLVQVVGVAAIYWLVEDNATDRARMYAVTFVGFGLIGYPITESYGGAVAIQLFLIGLFATVVQFGYRLLNPNAWAR